MLHLMWITSSPADTLVARSRVSLSLMAERRGAFARCLSPPPLPCFTLMAPLACDGASDPTPNVASGRRLDGGPSCWRVQGPGGLGRPLAGQPPAMAVMSAGRLQWLKAATSPPRD